MFLALDGELSYEEEKEFMDELNRCSWCLEQYHIEKAFKEFLSTRLQRKEIRPEIVREIKNAIRQISIE